MPPSLARNKYKVVDTKEAAKGFVNCAHVDHVLHDCASKAASELRAVELRKVGAKGAAVTLASATWDFAGLHGLSPPNTEKATH